MNTPDPSRGGPSSVLREHLAEMDVCVTALWAPGAASVPLQGEGGAMRLCSDLCLQRPCVCVTWGPDGQKEADEAGVPAGCWGVLLAPSGCSDPKDGTVSASCFQLSLCAGLGNRNKHSSCTGEAPVHPTSFELLLPLDCSCGVIFFSFSVCFCHQMVVSSLIWARLK